MYAVFSTGGKQYRASTGDIIRVEKLKAEEGATIELDQVLLVGDGKDVEVGTPFVNGGKVTAKVIEHGRGEKIKIIKFKRRKNYLKRQGHRQNFTMLEIIGIEGAASAKKGAGKEADKPAAKKAQAKKTGAKKTQAKKTAAKKEDKPAAASKAEKASKAESESETGKKSVTGPQEAEAGAGEELAADSAGTSEGGADREEDTAPEDGKSDK